MLEIAKAGWPFFFGSTGVFRKEEDYRNKTTMEYW
jgi:hypothetical protein